MGLDPASTTEEKHYLHTAQMSPEKQMLSKFNSVLILCSHFPIKGTSFTRAWK